MLLIQAQRIWSVLKSCKVLRNDALICKLSTINIAGRLPKNSRDRRLGRLFGLALDCHFYEAQKLYKEKAIKGAFQN